MAVQVNASSHLILTLVQDKLPEYIAIEQQKVVVPPVLIFHVEFSGFSFGLESSEYGRIFRTLVNLLLKCCARLEPLRIYPQVPFPLVRSRATSALPTVDGF